jgi:hypothetical protein
MIKLVFSSLFLISFCSACESRKIRVIDKESSFVELELIKEIKPFENESVKIGQASFSKIDVDTNLYIIDWSSSNLKVFSKNGNLIRIIGRAGKGPNELSNPMYFCFKGDEIWISEFDTDAFKVFSKNGDFLRKVSVNRSIEIDTTKAKVKFGDNIMKMFLGEFVIDKNGLIWYPGIDNNTFIGKPVVVIDGRNGNIVKTAGEYPKEFSGTDWGYSGSFVDVFSSKYVIGFSKSASFILSDISHSNQEWIATNKKSKPYISDRRPKQYSGDIEFARRIAMSEISNSFYAMVNEDIVLREYGTITETSIKYKSEVQRENYLELIDVKNNIFHTIKIKGRVCDFNNGLLLIEESDEPDNRRFGLYEVKFITQNN